MRHECSRIVSKFSIRHCAFRCETPIKQTLASSGLSGGCTKIGDVPKSPVPKLAALLPSAGIITLQVGAFGSGCRKHRLGDDRVMPTTCHLIKRPKSSKFGRHNDFRSLTSVKTNPTCAASSTAGTRWRMTATSLLGLFPVARNASRKTLRRLNGTNDGV
jgi:hypothetical protein